MDLIDRPKRIGNLRVMLGSVWIQLIAPRGLGDVGIDMNPIDCPQGIGNPRGDVGIDMNSIDRPKRIGNLRVMLGWAWIQLIALRRLVTPGDVEISMDPIDCPKRIGNLRVMLGSAWIQLIASRGLVTPGVM
ncbi:hypothetical protein Pyn_10080 [Prunus yedoensis var. nudiflora]|uniref:Uncharacterized protein n=1 Tax=Prunus yedoensis var. nudiflora TaxID=2094558 RepID=A0A314XT28_PRUYE|nr:hypothetical protein Pyn_10080 [Prunus yedoensis var. nudiflora]